MFFFYFRRFQLFRSYLYAHKGALYAKWLLHFGYHRQQSLSNTWRYNWVEYSCCMGIIHLCSDCLSILALFSAMSTTWKGKVHAVIINLLIPSVLQSYYDEDHVICSRFTAYYWYQQRQQDIHMRYSINFLQTFGRGGCIFLSYSHYDHICRGVKYVRTIYNGIRWKRVKYKLVCLSQVISVYRATMYTITCFSHFLIKSVKKLYSSWMWWWYNAELKLNYLDYDLLIFRERF